MDKLSELIEVSNANWAKKMDENNAMWERKFNDLTNWYKEKLNQMHQTMMNHLTNQTMGSSFTTDPTPFSTPVKNHLQNLQDHRPTEEMEGTDDEIETSQQAQQKAHKTKSSRRSMGSPTKPITKRVKPSDDKPEEPDPEGEHG